MRVAASFFLVAAVAAPVRAGLNASPLVPAYRPCTPPAASCQAVLESRFTFEAATLKSSKSPWVRDGKVAVILELKGVRDETGALVTTDKSSPDDDFVLVIPGSQVTVGGVTAAPGTLAPEIRVRVDLKNGKGSGSYKTPVGGEGTGVVAESTGAPYVLDGDGNRFAVTGSRDKPRK